MKSYAQAVRTIHPFKLTKNKQNKTYSQNNQKNIQKNNQKNNHHNQYNTLPRIKILHQNAHTCHPQNQLRKMMCPPNAIRPLEAIGHHKSHAKPNPRKNRPQPPQIRNAGFHQLDHAQKMRKAIIHHHEKRKAMNQSTNSNPTPHVKNRCKNDRGMHCNCSSLLAQLTLLYHRKKK